jgi:hypothetical protein
MHIDPFFIFKKNRKLIRGKTKRKKNNERVGSLTEFSIQKIKKFMSGRSRRPRPGIKFFIFRIENSEFGLDKITDI